VKIVFWVRAGNKFGGLERYIVLFAEECQKRGHSFYLINEVENTSAEYLSRLKEYGAIQAVVGESCLDMPNVFSKAIHQIRAWNPDIVQLSFVSSMAIPLLKIAGVPLVYKTYNTGIDHPISLRTRGLSMLNNWFATRVLTVSERVRKDEIRAGIKPDKIITSYRGIPLKDYETKTCLSGPPPNGWDIPHYKKIITIGRFFHEKGMRYVTEAAIRVMKDKQDVVWWLVGVEGPESDICNQMIQESQMSDRIQVLGQRQDVIALLHRSYVQVVGSLYEGLPLMVIEASACGVPTIGTKIGGLDEVLIDGTTGILVDRYSSQQLAEATIWLLEHVDKRNEMGNAAKQFIQEKFNSAVHINRKIEMFENDLSRHYLHQ
jgi:glycosyltransferase involved in cell wall biosynthesis